MKPDNTIRIYMSHTIRGKHGNKATPAQMQANKDRALQFANCLRAYFLDWERMDGLPPVDLYVPAEHDEFVELAWKKKYLNIDQILEID
ncbi:MAG: hypothetical protein DRI92_06150, partial [Aquificota bacterium]